MKRSKVFRNVLQDVSAAEDIKDKDGNVIVKANHMITPRRAERVMKKGVDENGNALEQVKIRTILTCKCKSGVCCQMLWCEHGNRRSRTGW